MPNRIMLVIGSCDLQNYSSIRDSVLEKLTRSEETGILFCRADELNDEAAVSDAVNNLVGNVDPDMPLDKRNANVAVILNGGMAAIDQLMGILEKLEKQKGHIGIWQFNYHLIWMAQEFPRLRYTYSELYDRLTGGEISFRHIYFLSDRHSNLRHGKDIRINGAALLLSALQNTENLATGFYTVGIGKNRITTAEMRDYAKHQAVESIKSQMFRWTQFAALEDICATSFSDEVRGEADLFPWLQNLMASRVKSTFAYVKGDDSTTCTKPEPLSSTDFSEILTAWADNIRTYLTYIPFLEKVSDFFRENGKFNEFIDRIEKQFYSYQTVDIKAGFLASGEQKEIIREYNEFRRMNQEEIRKGWVEFRKQWISMIPQIQDEADYQKKKRDEILSIYTRDDQFLQLCEDIAAESTRQIKQQIARLELSRDRFLSFSRDDEFTQAKAEKMMSWIAEETCKSVNQENMLKDLAEKDYGTLISQVFNPVISKSRVYLSCASSENFDDPNETYLFIPSSLYRDYLPLQYVRIVSIRAAEYQNVEALALLKLNTGDDLKSGADKLTAFHGTAVLEPEERVSARNPVADAKVRAGMPKTENQENQVEEEDLSNPWSVAVKQSDGRYRATYVWDDPIDLLTIRVENEDGYCRTTAQKRGDFLNQGYTDITELVDYGRNTVSLVSGGKVYSSTSFIGRRHTVEMEVEHTDFKLDANITLQKISMTVAAVDGIQKTLLSNAVCSGMRLLLGNKDLLPIPIPWEKHKQQGWTVIMENDKSYLPLFSEQYENSYEIHIT